MSLNKHSRKNNPLKPQRNFKDFLKFTAIAILLIILVEYVFFKGERPYITKMKQEYWAEQALMDKAIKESLPPKVVFPDDGKEYFESPALKLKDKQSLLPEKTLNITKLNPEKNIPKKTIKPAPKSFAGQKAQIAIVIDDIGMNVKQSHVAIDLPPEVTLALLPYAPSVRDMAKRGHEKGHELIIHTPMEAMSKDVPLGSLALYTDMDKAAFKTEFNKIANAFEGYVGINNHMGSKFTQDTESMQHVMRELKKRKLFFLDSKTIGSSIAAEIAQKNGVPNATRDVFLDHEGTPAFLTKALEKTESVARQHGSAIAIGHPKKVTMNALQKWIPTLEKKGFELVPLSSLVEGVKTKKVIVKAIKKQNETKPKIDKEDFQNIVGELTPEDKQVIIKPLDVQNEETGIFVVREPTKEIVIEKLGLPAISYPVD